jgi:hypothetical protein
MLVLSSNFLFEAKTYQWLTFTKNKIYLFCFLIEIINKEIKQRNETKNFNILINNNWVEIRISS